MKGKSGVPGKEHRTGAGFHPVNNKSKRMYCKGRMCPQLGMPGIKPEHAHCLGWQGDVWVPQAGTMEGGGRAAGTQRLPASCQLLRPTPSAAHSPPLSPRCSLLAPTPSLPFPGNCISLQQWGREAQPQLPQPDTSPRPGLQPPPQNSRNDPAPKELLKNTNPSARSAPANEASWSAGMAAA